VDRTFHTAICVLLILAVSLIPTGSGAETDGGKVELNLMVTTCDSDPLDGAEVVVNLYRPGVGIYGYESGYTDDGVIEFALSGIECDDEARVTVTPIGGDPDSDHAYTYVGNCGDNPTTWDIGASVEKCDDWWWGKEAEEVINTIYEEQD